MKEDEKLPFLSHLEELRKRLIFCAVGVGIGFAISYAFVEKLFYVLAIPLKAQMPEGDKLIFTGLAEMFVIHIKIAFIAGILLSSPHIFYQLWMFIAPGLYQHEKRYVIPFVISSTLLFLGGALFGYFFVFPVGFKFFLGYANDYIQALPSVKQYFSFAISFLFAFGIVFQLPVVVFFLSKMGVVTPRFMRQNRKYAILLIFVIAAILTPPDVISQFMMAIPLLILYEISIFVAKTAVGKKASRKETPEKDPGSGPRDG